MVEKFPIRFGDLITLCILGYVCVCVCVNSCKMSAAQVAQSASSVCEPVGPKKLFSLEI